MSSIFLQVFCGCAVLSILSSTVSSQYPAAKPPSATYGAPGIPQGGGGGYGGAPPPAPGGKPGAGGESSEPEPFSFNYQVKDEASGNDFGHKADSADGKLVQGEYNVQLPDGRKQIVTYTADENGYKADVKYEGEARPAPAGPAPQPGGGRPGGARPGGAPAPGGSYGPPPSGPAPAAPSGGYGPPPSTGFRPPPAAPAPAPSGGGSKGNFPSGYPSGGGGGPVKGSGGFGGY
uniref:Pro-resilin n=1 Tax=Cacopsylla melanoneura TaxID=428564 RepID=A0A8D8UB20_9HEMI